MLKHATISRTSRTQQAIQLQRQWHQEQLAQGLQQSVADTSANVACSTQVPRDKDLNNNSQCTSPTPTASLPASSPCPSPFSTPTKSRPASNPTHSPSNQRFMSFSSTGSLRESMLRLRPRVNNLHSDHQLPTTGSQDSIIKVFAQSLSQELEYVTLHVNPQTKTNQIIKSLLKKFRLRHRDPNLYYLTLERFIRKDGLKCKSVMLLGDEACPLQLQQCCSNPPHSDIKFSLLIRAGTTVKIFCSDVVPETRYKCLLLSTQTTVEETIELMLHCLNFSNINNGNNCNASETIGERTCVNFAHDPQRQSNSPGCTSSSSSTSTSSSSGIESEPTSSLPIDSGGDFKRQSAEEFKSQSRASSVTSISSCSNNSNVSSSLTEQFCLVIECNTSSFRRILEPDEYLVDVYQNLLIEAKSHTMTHSVTHQHPESIVALSNDSSNQWFFIKLKRRDDCIISGIRTELTNYSNKKVHHQGTTKIRFTNARKNVPLPPIPAPPSLLDCLTNKPDVINPQAAMSTAQRCSETMPNAIDQSVTETVQPFKLPNPPPIPPPRSSLQSNDEVEMLPSSFPSVTRSSVGIDLKDSHGSFSTMQPPSDCTFLPPVRPRRRNLLNSSSTFGRPMNNINRRRYDPAQLAEDLNRLDVRETETGDRNEFEASSLQNQEQSVLINRLITNQSTNSAD